MSIEIKVLMGDDHGALARVGEPGVFDDPVSASGRAAFFADARHMLGVAIDDGLVVGMVSAVEYFHPDKARPELWLNEVGVAESHRRRGLARRIIDAVLAEGRARGCTEAWVLTEHDNAAAQALYASVPGAREQRGVIEYSFPLT